MAKQITLPIIYYSRFLEEKKLSFLFTQPLLANVFLFSYVLLAGRIHLV